ncbi:MAG: GNAT family N-acetyltransferase [Ornithinibacter sp.]
MSTTPPLGDVRLRLEPLQVAHAVEMVAVLGDPGLYRFTGGEPPTLDGLEERYIRQVTGSGDLGESWHTWVVRLGRNGPAVGFVQATVHPPRRESELAWVVSTQWQGQGIARAAAGLVLTEVVDRGISRVLAHVHPDHVASQRVATALGLVRTDRLVDGEVEWVLEVPTER